ncbi:MAG: hydrolase [Candidatus Eisenbacteria bacterium]|uniref:Hydrolase n=1 Tax=Eiseniibacteriota bacterium TaxID=2212470 RepID=A0A948RTV1_UNCEI|nr:hydrolase [Candidatus Eisenbacteria bacterium]MBU1949368.1 hydrolase [Candidatus Eisenbacteria bacterium]MBU2690441.1 hydrolase [Candidatus Eisenbacteria bacterium]
MLRPTEAFLVVIDVQERLLPHIHQHGEMVQSIRRLIRGCKIVEVPIFATEQYTKGLGPTCRPVLETLEGVERMEKLTFSCWQHDPFREAVAATGRRQALLCGIESHVCVFQTALEMNDDGFEVFIVGDAVSSRFPRNIELAMMRFQQEGIRLTSVETAVFEMLTRCATEPFRAWSKILKEA